MILNHCLHKKIKHFKYYDPDNSDWIIFVFLIDLENNLFE
jgi:hypothetical protein